MTLSDALEAHAEAMGYGGRAEISSLDLVASAIARPYHGYHRSIEKKAAALLHAVVNNHGFVDGNKRTAFLLTDLLIQNSGYDLQLADAERVDDMVVAVAQDEMTFEELTMWFKEHIVRQA